MSGGVAVMDIIKRRVAYDKLKTIVDLPTSLYNQELEIIISSIEDENDSIYNQLHGCASNIKMTAEEARAERLSLK